MLRQIYSIPAVNWLRDVIATVIVGRIVTFSMLILLFFAYSTYEGYSKRLDVVQNFNLSEIHYMVHGKNCKVLVDGTDFSVLYRKSLTSYQPDFVECPPEDKNFFSKIASQHEGKTRGVYTGDVYITYIIAFIVYVLVALISIENRQLPNIARSVTLTTVIIGWVLISALLFPMVYRDYSSGAAHEYNGKEYYVSSVILSNDGDRYIAVSESFLSMNDHLRSNSPKSVSSM